jgi:uncharacterized protein (TIGR01777 family)
MPTAPSPVRVVIAGGSGFLGQSLTRSLLSKGFEVTVLSRSVPKHGQHVHWDARTLGPWTEALRDADAIVNLVGRTVDCIKTPDHCDEILRSRVEATRVLGLALREHNQKLRVWVQMSTAHIYGDPPHVVCNEESPFGYGLAPTVGRAWEEALREALPLGTRGVVLRTSFVLGRNGGALTKLARLARVGLGGRAGHGRQGMSWIHEADMNALFERAILNEEMAGAYIATAPNPVSNAAFMRALRKAVRMPIGLPAPAWLVRIGAPLVMRTDPELALYGRYCIPRRLQREGFEFRFPTLEPALADLLTPHH